MYVYAKRGILVRLLYLAIAGLWHVLSVGRFWKGETVVVLCYHGVPAAQKERFRRQMATIATWGIAAPAPNGRPHRLGKERTRVYVTFDDAFENLLENALPILDEFNISATVFAVPGNLGQTPKWGICPSHPDYRERVMTAEQLGRISNERIRIGSHSQTHPDLSRVSVEQMRGELTESKANLEKVAGYSVEDLALPHGAYNHAVLGVAREAGYERVYTQEPQMYKPGTPPGIVGRFPMSPDVWPIEFKLTCKGAYVWLHFLRKGIQVFRNTFLGIS